MLIRKPRGSASGPLTLGLTILIGVAAGVYIWGPTLQNFMNTDPEILAFRQKSKLERELEKNIEKTGKR